MTECPNCKGTGMAEHITWLNGSELSKCRECNGYGVIDGEDNTRFEY